MTIRTTQALTGFIATDPQLTTTRNGHPRLHARLGHPATSDPDSELVFHDLVAYRHTATAAHPKLRKGDRVIAAGRTRAYETGEHGPREEFVASHIGHDTTRHRPTRPVPPPPDAVPGPLPVPPPPTPTVSR